MVSVLIAARNEATRIHPTLIALHSLNYPGELEIILIDDHSEDSTEAIVHEAKLDHCIILKNQGFGKRAAIQTGLNSASGEIIVLTDADCQPGPNWITAMTAPFVDHMVHWVSGPVVTNAAASLASRYDALEWQGLLALTGSGFAIGEPVLSQGANIAFRRSSYDLVSRKSTLPNRASGDDVFLLAEFHNQYPDGCKFQSDQQALVYTLAPNSWAELIAQRLRWTSKSSYLNPLYGQIPLVLTFCMSLLFLAIPFRFVYARDSVVWLLIIPLFCKVIADFRLLSSGWKMTGDKPGWTTYLLAVLIHPLLVVFSGLVGPVRSSYLWKGRRVR